MMARMLRICVGAAFILALAVSSAAAQEKITVKVALLDMTSHMPADMMSYGMMSPGMMGPGMMGPGMMGQGNLGPGMMGQGRNAPNPNSFGMMGMMMAGMMSIRIDKPSVKAGTVSFDVTNWSRSVVHDVLVVPVANPTAPLPYDYGQARVPLEQIKVVGKAEELEPSGSKTFDVALTPGSYLLICNVPGHYAAGMATALAVTP